VQVPPDESTSKRVQAVLLVGFDEGHFEQFQAMMQGMGASMVPIMCAGACTLQGSLQEALEGGSPGFVTPPSGARRAVFLSGMYTAEVSAHQFRRTVATRRYSQASVKNLDQGTLATTGGASIVWTTKKAHASVGL
jgi:hypothetical protein